MRRLLFWLGLGLVAAGVLQMLATPIPAAEGTPWPVASWLGVGTLFLGFLSLASSHYFKLHDKRRADRAEARELHDRKNRSDDTN